MGLLLGCIERAALDSEDSDSGEGETEVVATDSGVDSEEPPDDDTGDGVPAECAGPDPAVDAGFELALAGEDPHSSYGIDAVCAVDAVAVEDDSVVTALTCTIAGAARQATLTLPVVPEGAVAWSPGKQVHVIAYSDYDDEVDTGWHRKVEVRVAGSEELLLLAVEDADETLGAQMPAPWFAPLMVEVVPACGPEGASDGLMPLALSVRDLDDNVVEVVSGHRAALPIDAEQSYAIDVQDATSGHCCHYTRHYHLIVRRAVTVGWWPD